MLIEKKPDRGIKSKSFSIRLHADTLERLARRQTKTGWDRTEIIEQLVEWALDVEDAMGDLHSVVRRLAAQREQPQAKVLAQLVGKSVAALRKDGGGEKERGE